MVSNERFDVTIVRWLDGHRIETEAVKLDAAEVLARKTQEECLPGQLVAFVKTPHDYVKHAKKYDG